MSYMKTSFFLYCIFISPFISQANQCYGGSYYNDNGDIIFKSCPIGKYAPFKKCDYDSNPCDFCPIGTFQNKTGQSTCIQIQNNCSIDNRTGLIEGAIQDTCIECEHPQYKYIYSEGLCLPCHERYQWTILSTNHTTCERIYPFDSVIFKVLFGLSILFIAVTSYFYDNTTFDRWCALFGLTLIIVVMALVYYDTDITTMDTCKWLTIGLIIELLIIAIYKIIYEHCVKSDQQPNPSSSNPEPQKSLEVVCFD